MNVAAIQMCSSKSIEDNIKQACDLIEAAANAGAQFIVTPEMTSFVVNNKADLLARACKETEDPALKAFQSLAKRLKVYVQIGSIAILGEQEKCFNRSFLINSDGEISARYDKIHLFDVDLPNGEVFKESASYHAGETAVIANLPQAKLGLSICYDLRFPSLYSALAKNGAEIIVIPAAFTHTTGLAHWHVLCRARAIETACFIIAAAQVGQHEDGRTTYGHSLIISPWGDILAEADGVKQGFINADINLADVATTRQRIANLQHQKPFQLADDK